ncbi:siphovirus Gp157 family protein [Devosia sp. Naph2]|uniref:siphovirus Gp157 family protein n=1 Tax=Devosia polycyclovorans TaxID=3345148 RepID=UPI0035CEB166
MMKTDIEGEIRQETILAQRLVEQLAEVLTEDEAELRCDMVQGETGLVEAIARTLEAIEECEVMEDGIAARIEVLSARKRRVLQRHELLAGLIEQALMATGISPLRLPTATLSLARRAPGLVLESEAEIPSAFWVLPEQPAPRLDKKAILAALNAGQAVPGAALAEPTYSLTIRRK